MSPDLKELVALQSRAALLNDRWNNLGSALLPGAHIALQRGRGLDFAEVRAYQAGDDIRAMDWRQTARRGKPYTKLFHAERERPTHLVVDLGPSMRFGTRVAFKSVVAARAAALLAWSAAAVGDRVGGAAWSGAVLHEAPVRAHRQGVLGLLRQLSNCPRDDGGSLPASVLNTMLGKVRGSDRVVMLSDFRAWQDDAWNALGRIGRQAELILVFVHDPFESDVPPPGVYALTDGSREMWLDFQDEGRRAAHVQAWQARRDGIRRQAVRIGAGWVDLSTRDDPLRSLRGVLS